MTEVHPQLGLTTLCFSRRELVFNGHEIRLTTREFQTIAALAERFGDIVSRDELSLRLYGVEWNGTARSVDMCVGRLRKKLKFWTAHGLQIRTVRSGGYFLVAQGDRMLVSLKT